MRRGSTLLDGKARPLDSDRFDEKSWIDPKQVVGIRAEDGPPTLTRQEHDVGIDRVLRSRSAEHSADHLRNGLSEIHDGRTA